MAELRPRETRTSLGVFTMAFAVMCFTGIDSSAKWLILAGLAPIQVVFIRYAGHFLFALLLYVPQSGFKDFKSNAPFLQLIRSLFLFSGTILNFSALKFLPITFTTTIFFAAPIIVTLAAIPILGEKVGVRRIVAVCTGFVGVLITIQPWGVSFHPAMFLSLAALCCASGYFVMTRMVAGIETNATSQLWSSAIGTVVLAPFGIAAWVPLSNTVDIVFMVLIGGFGLIGHIATAGAHRLADASILAPMVYIQIFLAAAVSFFVFDTAPSQWTVAGGMVIIASGLYIWHRERRKAQEDA